jgi:DNA-binding NtrC family response regulator
MLSYLEAARTPEPGVEGAGALVITANEGDRRLLLDVIKAASAKAYFAANLLEARQLLSRGDIRLVLIDGDDGALCWRKMLEHSPAGKIVVYSGLADGRLCAEVLNLGGYDVLAKPLSAKEVAWVVRSAIGARGAALKACAAA